MAKRRKYSSEMFDSVYDAQYLGSVLTKVFQGKRLDDIEKTQRDWCECFPHAHKNSAAESGLGPCCWMRACH